MRVYTGNPQKADPSDHIQLLSLFSMSTLCDGGSALGEAAFLPTDALVVTCKLFC